MNYKHGHAPSGKRTPTLGAFHEMHKRCYKPKNKRYPLYGGRGITVCERWQDFNNFLLDMGEKPSGMSLDRINNDGPYSPKNCRWASAKTQARNRRTSKIIKFNGEEKSLAEWCELIGLNYTRTLGRINKCGWPIERAFNTFD